MKSFPILSVSTGSGHVDVFFDGHQAVRLNQEVYGANPPLPGHAVVFDDDDVMVALDRAPVVVEAPIFEDAAPGERGDAQEGGEPA